MNRRILIALAASVAFLPPARAGEPEIFTGLVDGVALGGYDAVSYGEDGGPKPGKAELSTRWKDVTWRFASRANLDAFTAEPEKYSPQYGGYCAFAVARGATAKGDPKVWSKVDGKLYLNISPGVKEMWAKDIPGNIASANANWPGVLE